MKFNYYVTVISVLGKFGGTLFPQNHSDEEGLDETYNNAVLKKTKTLDYVVLFKDDGRTEVVVPGDVFRQSITSFTKMTCED